MSRRKVLIVSLITALLSASVFFGVTIAQANANLTQSYAPVNANDVIWSHPNMPAPGVGPKVATSGAASFLSYNWAGYALVPTPGVLVTYVQGTWKVPSVHGTLCKTTAWHASSDWIGIDGFNSGTVEQIGTASQCFEGTLQYYAWYEFYPSASVLITSVPISPGDKVTAHVTFSAGKFVAYIKDITTGKSFKTAPTVAPGAVEGSAEWIAESPFGGIGELEMANYGTTHFSSAQATVGGTKGTLGSFATIASSLTMVDYPAGAPLKASVTSISTAGTSFSTKWLSQGPYG